MWLPYSTLRWNDLLLADQAVLFQHSVGTNPLNVSLPRLNKGAKITIQGTSLRLM